MAQPSYKYNMLTNKLFILLFLDKQMAHYYMFFLLITSFLSHISWNPSKATISVSEAPTKPITLRRKVLITLVKEYNILDLKGKNISKIAENTNNRGCLTGSNLEFWPYASWKSWNSRVICQSWEIKRYQQTDLLKDQKELIWKNCVYCGRSKLSMHLFLSVPKILIFLSLYPIDSLRYKYIIFLVPSNRSSAFGLIQNQMLISDMCSVLSPSVLSDFAPCQAPLSMGILQARILEWVAMPFSRGSS